MLAPSLIHWAIPDGEQPDLQMTVWGLMSGPLWPRSASSALALAAAEAGSTAQRQFSAIADHRFRAQTGAHVAPPPIPLSMLWIPHSLQKTLS